MPDLSVYRNYEIVYKLNNFFEVVDLRNTTTYILCNFCVFAFKNDMGLFCFRTDTDHTCYTIKTVGRDGFLELLPIYLDHILFPTLSDAGYITEVHHIAPNGEDSGVVYCEVKQFFFEYILTDTTDMSNYS